jgi:ComF family protein
MAQYFKENQLVGDILLPVPLHDRRLKERGYNQSELLAREISKVIALPVKVNLVKRVKDNKPQARTVSVKERRINMLNAFVCTSSEVYGKDIVIIDDVCTSGATLESCAVALKAGGARNILGFTLAREIFHGS